MTKLIGHYYNKNDGTIEIAEIEAKEIARQFSKSSKSCVSTPCDYWSILPKNQLDVLRVTYSIFHMYSRKENKACFRELVIARLEQMAHAKKLAHEKILNELETLRKEALRSESDENV